MTAAQHHLTITDEQGCCSAGGSRNGSITNTIRAPEGRNKKARAVSRGLLFVDLTLSVPLSSIPGVPRALPWAIMPRMLRSEVVKVHWGPPARGNPKAKTTVSLA